MDLIENSESRMEDIKEKAADAEANASAFMEPGTKAGKKRGPYKKKSKPEREKKQDQGPAQASSDPQPGSAESIAATKQILTPVFAIGSQACARWADTPKALMSPQELETVSHAAAAVIDKYLPSVLDKYGAEILLFTTVGMYGARVVTLKRARDAEKGVAFRNGSQNQQASPFHPQVQTDEKAKETVVEAEFSVPN